MKVLILCGGQGTRLSGAGGDAPKPMIPIGGRPILWHIMSGLAHWGCRDFVLCLGHRSDDIRQYFLNLPYMLQDVRLDYSKSATPVTLAQSPENSWNVTLAETGLESMTGFRVRMGAMHLSADEEIFGVTYGDGVSDLDYRKVIAFHKAHGKIATVTAVHPPGRFGELELTSEGCVREFNEKPQATSGWISGGFFVFSRRILDYLPPDPSLMLEEEPLRRLAREGQLMAYPHEGFWFCVDTPRDLSNLTRLWSEGRAPWNVWSRNPV